MPDLAALTWEEIRALAQGGGVAVVPTGSLEQHGHHLPVEVDSCLVGEVCRRAVARVEGKVPVGLAPVLWLGCSPHHLPYFALSVDAGTYTAMVVQVGKSLVQAGFQRILFINGHGGNMAPLRLAVQQLGHETDALVGATSYFQLAAERIAQIRESAPGGLGHACEMETSLMMAVKPGAVRRDKIQPGTASWVSPLVQGDLVAPGPVSVGFRWPEVTPSGVLGRPDLATAEKGEAFLEAAVEGTARLIEEFAGWSRERLAGP